jgi:hypothetical protein
MKIPTSVRYIFEDRKPLYEKLREAVDKKLGSVKKEEWHYISRVKGEESYALKVESGRYADISTLEDFFACTLVVPNFGQIKKAEAIVRSIFEFSYRRPTKDKKTHKPSHSFEFDDLRLYAKWVDDPDLPPTELNGLVFEIQIKTFLQHAWSIATHDLIYKSCEANWSKERIAFQIKAMLEHAESSIQQAEDMAKSSSAMKTDQTTKRLSSLITLLGEIWKNEDDLPEDKKRLSSNVLNLLKCLEMKDETLKMILVKETELGRGARTRNLSPYGVIVQSILNQDPRVLLEYMENGDRKIFMPREIEFPAEIDIARLKNTIRFG